MTLVTDLGTILECAEDELMEAGRSVPDDVLIAPGLPAFDNQCGQLWVRVIRSFPSDSFPNRFLDARNCRVGIATQIGLGIIRCQTGLERLDTNDYPTPDEQTADALGLVCDEGALFRALACCFPSTPGAPDLVVDEWTQLEPQGGVIGGEWTAYVASSLWCEA